MNLNKDPISESSLVLLGIWWLQSRASGVNLIYLIRPASNRYCAISFFSKSRYPEGIDLLLMLSDNLALLLEFSLAFGLFLLL